MKRISDILRDAKGLMTKYGWIKGAAAMGRDEWHGSPHSVKHRFCVDFRHCHGFSAYGAIYRVAADYAREDFGPKNYSEHAIDAMCQTVGVETRRELERWHDASERTRREVNRAIDATIFRLDHGSPAPDQRHVWDQVRKVRSLAYDVSHFVRSTIARGKSKITGRKPDWAGPTQER